MIFFTNENTCTNTRVPYGCDLLWTSIFSSAFEGKANLLLLSMSGEREATQPSGCVHLRRMNEVRTSNVNKLK